MDSSDFFYQSRKNLNIDDTFRLSSGNNLYPPPLIYGIVLKHMISDINAFSDYQEAGGGHSYRAIIADSINRYNQIDYYNNENVFITLGSTDAIDIVVSYMRAIHKSIHAYYTLPCYYTFIQSAVSYGYDIDSSRDLDVLFNAELLNKLSNAPHYSVVYINNPNSITGVPYSTIFFKELFELIKMRKIYCIIDEIIGEMPLFKDDYTLIKLAAQCESLDNLFIISSLSKKESLPGVRVGQMLVPKSMSNEIENFIRQRYVSVPRYVSELLVFHKKISSSNIDDIGEITSKYRISKEDIEAYKNYKINFRQHCQNNIKRMSKFMQQGMDFPIPQYGHSLLVSKPAIEINYWDIIERSISYYNMDIAVGPYFGSTLEYWTSLNRIYIRINISHDERSFMLGINNLMQLINVI